MQIIDKSVALIHYTLKNDDGEVLDTSEGRDPLAYLHGAGNIVPGLEAELEGKTAGESLEVRIDPANGYGEKQEKMVQTIPREHMPDGVELEVGMQLQAQTPEGEAQLVTQAPRDPVREAGASTKDVIEDDEGGVVRVSPSDP